MQELAAMWLRIQRWARVAGGAALWAPVLLLAACGGGGGGGDSGAGSSTVTGLVITSSNSQAVAADALDASTDLGAAQDGSVFVTGVQVQSGAAGGSPVRLAAATRKLLERAPAPTGLVSGVAISESVACEGGGSIMVSGEAFGGSVFVAGDRLTIAAFNCREVVEGDTVIMNGSITVTVVSGSYDSTSTSYPKNVTITVVTSSFSITEAAETITSNGDLRMEIAETSATMGTVVLSGTALGNSVSGAGGSFSTTLRGYRHTITESIAGLSVDVSATVESTNSRLGAGILSYQISTPTPLSLTTAGDYTAGSLLVRGSNSALLLTVTATNVFSVQVDANGDGTHESSSSVTLAQLQALH